MGILEGRVAIVTGAGQGVGQGIAIELAREGAAVAVTGRTDGKLHDTVARIVAAGGKALPIAGDVKNPADIARIIDTTVRELGGIDILVNNAQEVFLGPLLDQTDEGFIAGFESGPLATFRLMKAAHPWLKKSGRGAIVNLATSAAVRWDMSSYGTYAAVKQAIRSLTRAAAAEWGPDNIRVNAVAPFALSPALEGWERDRPEEAAAFKKTVPLGRIGDCAADIGRAVVFLCGGDAQYVTGMTMPLDGGQANFD